MMNFKKSLVSNGAPKEEMSGEEMPMGEGEEMGAPEAGGDIAAQIEALKADFEQKLNDLKTQAGIGGEEEVPEMPMEEEVPEGEPAGEMGEPGLAKKKMPGMMISLGFGGKK